MDMKENAEEKVAEKRPFPTTEKSQMTGNNKLSMTKKRGVC
jgi:hypothetical protein